MRMKRYTATLAALAVVCLTVPAQAQIRGGGSAARTPTRTATPLNGLGGAQGIGGMQTGMGGMQTINRDQGLTQTGTLQSEAAIQRNQSGFVGRTAGEHPRSMAGQVPTSVNAQFQSPRMGAVGVGGLGGLGGGRGGRGGFGGGLGGLGGGLGGFGGGLGGLGGGLGGFGGGLGGLGGGLGGLGMGGLGGPMGMTGFGAPGQMGMGAMGGMNQRNAAGPGQAGQQMVRTRLSLGFDVPPVTATAVTNRFSERLRRLPGLGSVDKVTVGMDGSVAVLSGTVTSARDRDLIGRLALLEPGIQSVRNELLVAPASDASSPSAAR